MGGSNRAGLGERGQFAAIDTWAGWQRPSCPQDGRALPAGLCLQGPPCLCTLCGSVCLSVQASPGAPTPAQSRQGTLSMGRAWGVCLASFTPPGPLSQSSAQMKSGLRIAGDLGGSQRTPAQLLPCFPPSPLLYFQCRKNKTLHWVPKPAGVFPELPAPPPHPAPNPSPPPDTSARAHAHTYTRTCELVSCVWFADHRPPGTLHCLPCPRASARFAPMPWALRGSHQDLKVTLKHPVLSQEASWAATTVHGPWGTRTLLAVCALPHLRPTGGILAVSPEVQAHAGLAVRPSGFLSGLRAREKPRSWQHGQHGWGLWGHLSHF